MQKVKQVIWRFLYPIWPQLEHWFLFLHGNKRQRFHVGWLAPNRSVSELKNHLAKKWGFGNHFVAWEDQSQVLSLRKLTSFNEQYHLCLFSDGEIRGHYEFTPEAAPIRHLMKVDQKAKTKDFLNFLGSYVTTKKHISKIPFPKVSSKGPEVTFHK